MIIIDFYKKIKVRKSTFVQDVLILVGGTGLSQIISFLLTPVLTRIYSPIEYGVFGLYTMIILVLSNFPTLQLHNIIIIDQDDSFAKKASGVIILIASIISFLMFILIIFTKNYLANFLGIVEYTNWLLIVPIFTWINSINLMLMTWANRLGNFKIMSKNRIILAICVPLTSILLGYLVRSAQGLIIGYIIGNLIVTFLLIRFFIFNEKLNFSFNSYDIREVLSRYKDFPYYSLPASIINVSLNQIPLLMLNIYGSASIVGHFNLCNRTLGMPIILISSSFNEVFKQRASLEYNTYGRCDRLFLKSFFSLLTVSVVLFGVFFVFGPNIFSYVFGEQWTNAGQYSSLMAPLFIMRFSISPLTYLFIIANKQKYDLWGHLGMLLIITISFPVSYSLSDDPNSLIVGYTVAYCIVYLFYFILSYKFSRGVKNNVL